MRCKNIFILVFGVLLLGAVSASFSFYENGSAIITDYEASDYLKANLNISFFNESLNSTFTDTLGNSIKLGALLEKTPEYGYLFYDISNTTIASAFQLLDMSKAEFVMPNAIKNLTYSLSLGDTKIFSRTFRIMSNRNLIQETLNKKYSELNASVSDIAKYDSFTQRILNETINITTIENNLKGIQTQFANANTNDEYNKISSNLSSIKIPRYISEAVSTNPISFYPSREKINLDSLKEIGGGDYGENKEAYLDSIYSWDVNNLKTTLTFREIAINYGVNETITTLRIFEFNFNRINVSGDAYFIIDNLENLKFEDLSSQVKKSTYGYYINLNDIPDKLVLSTTSNVNFVNIPAFISPPLDSLSPQTTITEPPRFFDNKNAKWILFGIIVFLVLLMAIVTYILLQRWYRIKYENHLFKNRNNLYNIMTYIQNAKKKGMQNQDILKDLKKANWTREQINYALKKYEGKKIAGIIERPFKNVVQELEKNPFEPERKFLEAQRTPFEPQRRLPLEAQKKPLPLETQRKPFEPQKKPLENQKKPSEPQKKPSEEQKKPSEPNKENPWEPDDAKV
jgi:hypothetical protein